MLFDEVCSDVSDSSKFPITAHSVAEHIRLLVKVGWVFSPRRVWGAALLVGSGCKQENASI